MLIIKAFTAAVIQAIRERIALLEIGKRGREIFIGPPVDHAEMLYDENGLPK